MSKYKIDFDLKKKIVFRLVSEVINLFEPKDLRVMIERKLRFYDVIKDNMPELISYLTTNGNANAITKEYIGKLMEPDNLQEFVYFHLKKFEDLFTEVPTARSWLFEQIQYIFTNVWT